MNLHHLFESMIKIPKDLQNDLLEFIYAYIYSLLTEIGYEQDQVSVILEHIGNQPKHENLFKSINFKHNSKLVMNVTLGVQSYNFKYDMSDSDQKLTIRLIEDNTTRDLGWFHSDSNTIDINIHKLKMLLTNKDFKKEFLKYILSEYYNTLEHEIMHYVQFNSFGKIDPLQTQTDDNGKGVDGYIKYATSPAEFLPTIKSEYNSFINKANLLKQTAHMNRNDVTQLLRYFTGDESARVDRFSDVLDDFRSHFFWNLKKKNFELWKKAVKTIMNELDIEDVL